MNYYKKLKWCIAICYLSMFFGLYHGLVEDNNFLIVFNLIGAICGGIWLSLVLKEEKKAREDQESS